MKVKSRLTTVILTRSALAVAALLMIPCARAQAGNESNWIQTVPGRGWFACLRLYGPLEPWFDKTWKPAELELQK
jgi:hypothetical protein